MPRYPYRELKPTAEAEEVYKRWIHHLNDEFTRHKEPKLRSEIVRDQLYQLYLGRPHGGKLNFTMTTELPGNVLQLTFDSNNVTLEPEYYGDIDKEKYCERKPLIWFWQMFDRSPAGLNHWLGFRFRCMLAHHIFKSVGKNVKIFQGVEFSYGYNLTIEDNVVIHKGVMLDDRGEIIIKQGTSISDFSSIYSHSHDPIDQSDVTLKKNEIGPFARLTFHSSVMAGVNVGENAMLGAMGVATRDIPAESIRGGVPARELKKKSDIQRSVAQKVNQNGQPGQ